jgi:hypothetical protein
MVQRVNSLEECLTIISRELEKRRRFMNPYKNQNPALKGTI